MNHPYHPTNQVVMAVEALEKAAIEFRNKLYHPDLMSMDGIQIKFDGDHVWIVPMFMEGEME